MPEHVWADSVRSSKEEAACLGSPVLGGNGQARAPTMPSPLRTAPKSGASLRPGQKLPGHRLGMVGELYSGCWTVSSSLEDCPKGNVPLWLPHNTSLKRLILIKIPFVFAGPLRWRCVTKLPPNPSRGATFP